MQKTVLIVDDSIYMRSVLKKYLEKAGYTIVGEAENAESAIDIALELKPTLITLDIILPDMVGLDIIKVLKTENLLTKIILISIVEQSLVIKKGLELGANAYLMKPFDKDELFESAKNLDPPIVSTLFFPFPKNQLSVLPDKSQAIIVI